MRALFKSSLLRLPVNSTETQWGQMGGKENMHHSPSDRETRRRGAE